MSTSDSENEHNSSAPSHKIQDSGKSQLHQRLAELNSEFETAVRYVENPSELVEFLLGPSTISFKKNTSKIPSPQSAKPLSPSVLMEGKSSIKVETVSSHSPMLIKTSGSMSPTFNAEKSLPDINFDPLDPEIVQAKASPSMEISENPIDKNIEATEALIDSSLPISSEYENRPKIIPETPFIEPRILKLLPPHASTTTARKVNDVSLQHEISKAIDKHYGVQRPFSIKDTSKKVLASPLAPHLRMTNKALSLEEWKTTALDLCVSKISDRIDALSNRNEWSYRQMKRQPSIQRPLSHWDRLLEEMQWLHTDFIEEKKWKVAMAAHIAYTVVKWHNSSNKSSLCTRSYFKKDGTINSKWLEKNISVSSGVFDLDKNCLVSNSNSRSLETMPMYEFYIDEKAIYQDVIEKGVIVPIEKLMESYIRFIPINYSSFGTNISGVDIDPTNPFHGIDFQGFLYQPMECDLKPSISDSKAISEKSLRDWSTAEDQFIRKRAPELGFNWDLVASLLNSRTSTRLSCQRTSEECSKRWTYVSSISYPEPPESKVSSTILEEPEKDSKKRLHSRFLLLEEIKKKSCKSRDPVIPAAFNMSDFTCDIPSDSVVELAYTNAIDLIKVKLEEESIKKRKAEPKETPVPSIANAQPQLTPVSQISMLPRLAPAPGLPYPLLARPNLHTSIQAMNYMRANMGMLPNLSLANVGRVLPEQLQANLSSTSHPGHPATINPALRAMAFNPRNLNAALASGNTFTSGGPVGSNGRIPIPLSAIRPGATMTPFNINTPEGRAMASQLTQHNSIIYQRMVQYQQALMRSSQAGMHPSANLGQMQQPSSMDPRLLEQQRLLVRQIQENSANRPLMNNFSPNITSTSNSNIVNNQAALTPHIRPRTVLPNGSPPNITNPSPASQTPGTPKIPKARGKVPKKPTPVRKKNQKAPPDSSVQSTIPIIVTSATTPVVNPRSTPSISPNAISPRPIQYIPFSSVTNNTNLNISGLSHPLTNQIRYPIAHNLLSQNPMMTQHLINQHNQLQQLRQLNAGNLIPSLQFLPPQLGPSPTNVPQPQPSHQTTPQTSLPVVQTPNATQD